MTDIQKNKSKSVYSQTLKPGQPDKRLEDAFTYEIALCLNETPVKYSREMVVKIIDKIKKL